MQFNNNGQAIYLQIADYICEKVLLQEWNPDDKVPSVRELAIQLEVNPNTVMRTYDFLKHQDIINDKRGIGYFITPQAFKSAIAYRKREFLEKELPTVYRIMNMLGLETEDLAKGYEKFKKQYTV
ncbi:MAG: GntR family transcriptional regulator [Chitinophagaceae bacterium]|jgi:DNA-binding transcriptional regulator YhcF (GntR family)|nr:GntR family transcriptional regulator [Chitinophagaceae bacterium]